MGFVTQSEGRLEDEQRTTQPRPARIDTVVGTKRRSRSRRRGDNQCRRPIGVLRRESERDQTSQRDPTDHRAIDLPFIQRREDARDIRLDGALWAERQREDAKTIRQRLYGRSDQPRPPCPTLTPGWSP